MRKAIYVLLPVLIGLALRLYPTIISGLPFSTDAWSPIRNTELIMKYTPIPLNDKIFDGYNNYWPANSLFGAMISETTSISPVDAMAIFFPIVGATTILVFFVIVRRLYNSKISFIASIIFGTAFTHAFFTAGVTKETYANPIYLTLILLLLHPKISSRKPTILLFAMTSVTLALTHHLTSVIAIVLVSSITLAYFVNDLRKGLTPNKSRFLLTAILISTVALDFGLYAYGGFAYIPLSDWLSVAAYELLAFASALYLMYRPPAHTSTRIFTILAAAAVAFAFIFVPLILNITLVPSFTPSVQEQLLLYSIPYCALLPFLILGYDYRRGTKKTIAPLFWLAPLVGLGMYALFSNSSLGMGLLIRTPNFLWLPMAILSAAGLYQAYQAYGTAKGFRIRKLIKPAVVAIVLVVITVNVFGLYASVSLQNPNLGYQWLYRLPEFKAGAWIATTSENQTVAGDMKVTSLMQGYFGAKVDALIGYRYLAADSDVQPQILFTYNEMLKNGYVLLLHGVDLPANWTERASQLDLVYSNGVANLYAGENTS